MENANVRALFEILYECYGRANGIKVELVSLISDGVELVEQKETAETTC